jgi:hypothetical protein
MNSILNRLTIWGRVSKGIPAFEIWLYVKDPDETIEELCLCFTNKMAGEGGDFAAPEGVIEVVEGGEV